MWLYGLPTPLADILAADLTQLSSLLKRKVAVKTRKVTSLPGCHNYKCSEVALYNINNSENILKYFTGSWDSLKMSV